MKKSQLRQIIKEEISNALDEGVFDYLQLPRFRKNDKDIFDVLEDYAANSLSFRELETLADEYNVNSDELMQANWTRKNLDKSKVEEMVSKIKDGYYNLK